MFWNFSTKKNINFRILIRNSAIDNEIQANVAKTQTIRVAVEVKVLETLSNTNNKSIEFDKSEFKYNSKCHRYKSISCAEDDKRIV